MRWQVDGYVDVRIEEMGLSDFFPAASAVAGRIKHITLSWRHADSTAFCTRILVKHPILQLV